MSRFMCRTNQDSKLETENLLNLEAASNLSNELWLKSIFYEVTPVTPFYAQFWFLCFRDSVLKIESTSGLVLKSRIQFRAQITILTNRWKFHILDYSTPRVENFNLKLRSSCECMKSVVGLVWEVGTQILNLLWVSVLFW